MPRPRRARKPQRRTLRQRLLTPLKRLADLVRGRQTPPARWPKTARPSPKALLLPGAGRKRSLQEWKELRRTTAAEVKAHLAEEQPVQAIKKLTRALLEDPQHPPYHELLKKAVEQRRQRRLRAGRKDPWAELPRDLRQEALQLEAFTAYVDELEQLFDKAGIPPLAAPPPPGARPAPTGSATKAGTAAAMGGGKPRKAPAGESPRGKRARGSAGG
ncbi:hypothetical protein [Cyanobium sp. CH-040]|uniref:hypothetical protein n=1 Tax=Cyanobium sp. CH-040 TaxID=2823708 RepID=UPI0020CE502F|nr:hypothetical protein [Cyanobium sp. CH-040]MCP9928001.1 hypothetical protein [Cyanobium sp. CH-040]